MLFNVVFFFNFVVNINHMLVSAGLAHYVLRKAA